MEICSIFLLLGIHFLCLRYLHKFDFYGVGGPRWGAFFLSPLPIIFTYFLLRVFLRPLLTTTLVAGIEIILSFANLQKLSLLNDALSWTDISQFTNYPIVLRYLTAPHLMILALFFLMVGFVIWIEKKVAPPSKKYQLIFLSMALLSYPLVFYSSLPDNYATVANLLKHHLSIRGVDYFVVDWRKNVKLNGLPYHLAQTSGKKVPLSPTAEQLETFQKLIKTNGSTLSRPEKLIYILCESCWHDKTNFSDVFEPLRDRGFKELRAISPTYGGLTVNAAFEMLTGLPSRTNSLRGIIYQEYAAQMGKTAHALPRYLARLGYSTVAIHNHDRNFWHRNIINPKFGFEKFIGLQDMQLDRSTGWWADDAVLYESALKVLQEKKDVPLFLYLTTVYSHGPYEPGKDFGVTDFRKKLTKSIGELSKFVDQVSKLHPDALILVYGDHKPSLNEFFIKSGVLPPDAFDNPNISWDVVGDVPVYIRSADPKKADKVVKLASGLPFFCLIQVFDQEFLQSGVPAFTFSQENQLCLDYQNKKYGFYKKAYPDWLYALSLFNDSKERTTLRLHSLLDF